MFLKCKSFSLWFIPCSARSELRYYCTKSSGALWRKTFWTLWPASNRVAIDCLVRKACLRSRLSFCPNCIRVRPGLQLARQCLVAQQLWSTIAIQQPELTSSRMATQCPGILCKVPETSASSST